MNDTATVVDDGEESDAVDPVRGISGRTGDLRDPLGAKGIEKPPQGRGVAPRRCPHQPAAVVVDHHRQVLVVTLVGDLIDADAA
jgi:hypothetical protein